MKGINRFRVALTCAAIAGISSFTVVPTHSADQVRYARHSETAAALNEVPIAAWPLALHAMPTQPSDAVWDAWIGGHDTEIRARITALLRALRMPGTDERRLFARRFFEGNHGGTDPKSIRRDPTGRVSGDTSPMTNLHVFFF